MRALNLVEVQGAGDAVEYLVGDTADVAAFEPGVVLDRDTGQLCYLVAAQPGHPAPTAVAGQAGLLGGDLGAPGGQELPDLAADVLHAGHVSEARQAAWWQGGPGSTPHSSISLTPPAGGCLEVSPRCRGGLCARQARPSTTWKESSDVYAYGCQRAPG